MLPKCAQMLPKCAQMLPKYAQKLPKYVQMLLKYVKKNFLKCIQRLPKCAQHMPKLFWSHFGRSFPTLGRFFRMWPKQVISLATYWTWQFNFGHILATYGHSLDTFFVWTGFGHIWSPLGRIFVTFQENMTKMCPYTHPQVVPQKERCCFMK